LDNYSFGISPTPFGAEREWGKRILASGSKLLCYPWDVDLFLVNV
jgi:hypothetical protein